MNLFEIEKYKLVYRPTRTNEISFSLKSEELLKNKALSYNHRLIYIVKNETDFLYVGEAKSELKKRFQRSFTSYRYYKRNGKTRNGYRGYKWIELFERNKKKLLNELTVWAILFPSSFDDKRDFVEAIEGELVLKIREQTSLWPTHQNEIHFNNKYVEAQKIAQKILKQIK